VTDETPRTVLITGCSSGIGRALAREFARRGACVFASARRLDTIANLADDGIAALSLDVTDPGSIAAAVAAVTERAGRVDVLVNNAGFGLIGPAVEIPLDTFREQLEANVTGALAVTQAVAPGMMDRRSGLIVNVGSVSGILTTPFAGAYCASKAALHAITDALRLELAPFGVKVVSLQPGGVISSFGETATRRLASSLPANSRFGALARYIRARAGEGQRGALDTEVFARRVATLVLRNVPPRVIRLGRHSTRLPVLRWLLPLALTDRLLSRRYGLSATRPARQ
jgi:NAD(P)-dependent dehydrogenase (short-subunit alcohol dehydrogenase family)